MLVSMPQAVLDANVHLQYVLIRMLMHLGQS